MRDDVEVVAAANGRCMPSSNCCTEATGVADLIVDQVVAGFAATIGVRCLHAHFAVRPGCWSTRLRSASSAPHAVSDACWVTAFYGVCQRLCGGLAE